MHGNREHIETGRSLISYAANYPDLFRRAGDYVDKSLRDAKPGDIPSRAVCDVPMTASDERDKQ